MLFMLITIGLFLLSLGLALYSIRKEFSKPNEIHQVSQELKKERVLFQK